MNGMKIFGNAANNGVRRAADMLSAAMARCTTRKSVHQYPNESTKPKPATRPKTSTPIGFSLACPTYCQECVITGGKRALQCPDQPPAFAHRQDGQRREPEHDQEKLQRLRYKSRSSSPPSKVYTSTIAAESSTELVKLQPSTSCEQQPERVHADAGREDRSSPRT